jgi:hypothetical protein
MNVLCSSVRLLFSRWILFGFCVLLSGSFVWARQTPQGVSAEPQPQIPGQEPAKISGQVTDQTGATVTGATVRLTRDGQSLSPEVTTDQDGKFYFFQVPPGPFQLTFSSPGLASREIPGTLKSGETYTSPVVILAVATQVEQVLVTLSTEEIATAEIMEQEKQRVFGVIPNFYASYNPHAAPLNPRHKFDLAWKTMRDPVTFVAIGAVAGAAQAGNRWSGYGQGAEGYAKRFGATYGDVFLGTYLGGAVLPTVLKQDPRYFYKGTGSSRSRLLYALRSVLICKGDNGHWQPNYSQIGGNFAAGALSNLYYPARNRNATSVVVSTAMIRIGEIAAANVFQEFFSARLTPSVRNRNQSQP